MEEVQTPKAWEQLWYRGNHESRRRDIAEGKNSGGFEISQEEQNRLQK